MSQGWKFPGLDLCPYEVCPKESVGPLGPVMTCRSYHLYNTMTSNLHLGLSYLLSCEESILLLINFAKAKAFDTEVQTHKDADQTTERSNDSGLL